MLRLIRFCDRFDICEAALAAAKPLGKILHQYGVGTNPQDDFEFVFNTLHADNPTMKTLARFLAKTLYNPEHFPRGFAEKFILGCAGSTQHVLRAELQMTTYNIRYNGSRSLNTVVSGASPSYVPEDAQT